jgi:hypothetical protein
MENGMPEWFRRRYLDVVGSIYIYNEHRGYTAIDRVIEAVRERSPEDFELIKQIERHRADERKHYVMFRRWFERRGVMPLKVDRSFGHIDRFVEIMFQKPIARLHTHQVVSDNAMFERLCRVISLTEKRGFRQVEILLSNRLILSDLVLTRIFKIIHHDEPSHWSPYDDWLDTHAMRTTSWWERAVDGFIHAELLFIKLPFLFLNPWASRCTQWADAAEQVRVRDQPARLITAS